MEDFLQMIRLAPAAAFFFFITLATSLMDFLIDRSIQARFILHPYTVVRERQYYRILTCGLIHGNWLHLFFNMYVFYNFAFVLEAFVLQSPFYFALIYVFSQIVSALPSVIQHKNNPAYYALGASGAIAGVLFSFIALMPNEKFYILFFNDPNLGIPAWIFGLVYLAFSFVMGRKKLDNIGHDAHFWGAIAGALLTLAFMPRAVIQAWQFYVFG